MGKKALITVVPFKICILKYPSSWITGWEGKGGKKKTEVKQKNPLWNKVLSAYHKMALSMPYMKIMRAFFNIKYHSLNEIRSKSQMNIVDL